jgi:hypothetical protein
MLITGMDTNGILSVEQPTADSMDPRRLVVSNNCTIPAGGYGEATKDLPWWLANGDGMAITALSAGDEGGSQAGSWVMGAGTGYFVLAVDSPTSPALVMCGGGGGGGDDYALFDAVSGMGTPYFSDLTNSVCFYSCKLWNGWNTAGGSNQGLQFTEAIWVFGVYNPIIYNDTSPGTPFKLDGNSVHKVKYTGLSYNPTDGTGTHGLRRVFFTTEAGWAWRVDCAATGPATDNEG